MTVDPLVTADTLALYQAGDTATELAAAHAAVRRYCRWHVAPLVQETVTLTGNGARSIVLRTMRVFSVQSVTNGEFVYTSVDYRWDEGGVLTRTPVDGVWVLGEPVVVTFTHGFATAPDVAKVIADLASRSSTAPGAVVRRQAGPYLEEYATSGSGFTPSEESVLDLYKLAPRP